MQKQKIPITVIATMVIQTIATIWWLAKLDLRVQIHDQFIERNHELMETVYRLEERVKTSLKKLMSLSKNTNKFYSDKVHFIR